MKPEIEAAGQPKEPVEGVQTTRRGLLVGSTMLLSSGALAATGNLNSDVPPGAVRAGPQFRRLHLDK